MNLSQWHGSPGPCPPPGPSKLILVIWIISLFDVGYRNSRLPTVHPYTRFRYHHSTIYSVYQSTTFFLTYQFNANQLRRRVSTFLRTRMVYVCIYVYIYIYHMSHVDLFIIHRGCINACMRAHRDGACGQMPCMAIHTTYRALLCTQHMCSYT